MWYDALIVVCRILFLFVWYYFCLYTCSEVRADRSDMSNNGIRCKQNIVCCLNLNRLLSSQFLHESHWDTVNQVNMDSENGSIYIQSAPVVRFPIQACAYCHKTYYNWQFHSSCILPKILSHKSTKLGYWDCH